MICSLGITVNSPRSTPSESKPIFEAESPDELALVETAYCYNCRLTKRTPTSATVSMPGNRGYLIKQNLGNYGSQ